MKINDISFRQAVDELSRGNIPLKKNRAYQTINQEIIRRKSANKEYLI